MWERLRRFRRLSRAERRLFLRAVGLLSNVAIRLRLSGFGKTKSWLDRKNFVELEHQTKKTDEPAKEAAAIARIVRAAAGYSLGPASCLEQSLVLWWLLARAGIRTELRVGVRKSEEKFEAHAWVEFNGSALNETESPHKHFAAFAETLMDRHSGKA